MFLTQFPQLIKKYFQIKSRASTVPAKTTVLEYRLIFHKGQNFKLLYIANGYNIPQIPYLQKK